MDSDVHPTPELLINQNETLTPRFQTMCPVEMISNRHEDEPKGI